MEFVQLQQGEFLFRDGAPAGSIWLLMEGEVCKFKERNFPVLYDIWNKTPAELHYQGEYATVMHGKGSIISDRAATSQVHTISAIARQASFLMEISYKRVDYFKKEVLRHCLF